MGLGAPNSLLETLSPFSAFCSRTYYDSELHKFSKGLDTSFDPDTHAFIIDNIDVSWRLSELGALSAGSIQVRQINNDRITEHWCYE